MSKMIFGNKLNFTPHNAKIRIFICLEIHHWGYDWRYEGADWKVTIKDAKQYINAGEIEGLLSCQVAMMYQPRVAEKEYHAADELSAMPFIKD